MSDAPIASPPVASEVTADENPAPADVPAGTSDPSQTQGQTQDQSQSGDRLQEVKSQLQAWGEELKQEIVSRIDQKLDELGAKIGAL